MVVTLCTIAFALVQMDDVSIAKVLRHRFLAPHPLQQGRELSGELRAAVLENACRNAVRAIYISDV